MSPLSLQSPHMFKSGGELDILFQTHFSYIRTSRTFSTDCSISGVSNIWQTGQNRPAKGSSVPMSSLKEVGVLGLLPAPFSAQGVLYLAPLSNSSWRKIQQLARKNRGLLSVFHPSAFISGCLLFVLEMYCSLSVKFFRL